MVVDPWGKILGEAGQQDLDVVIAELDFDKLANVRQNMPCFDHRREDVYNLSYVKGTARAETSGTKYNFGGIDIPQEMVFYTSEHSFAFVNIRCVVPGRKSFQIAPILLIFNNPTLNQPRRSGVHAAVRTASSRPVTGRDQRFLPDRVQGSASCGTAVRGQLDDRNRPGWTRGGSDDTAGALPRAAPTRRRFPGE